MRFLLTFVALSLAGTSNAVTIDGDCSQAQDLCGFMSKVKQTLEGWYPYFANQLNSPGFGGVDRIPIFLDPNYDGVAYAAGGRIVGAVNYYRSHQDDVGSMIHEMVHVIQGYRNGHGWLVEGIADYCRYYHYEPNRKPGKPGGGNSYRDGYGVTAYFLNYIQTTYGDMVYWLNKDCREGTYNDDIWPRLLDGKTLDKLWSEMMQFGRKNSSHEVDNSTNEITDNSSESNEESSPNTNEVSGTESNEASDSDNEVSSSDESSFSNHE